MKLFAATVTSLSLLASACAGVNRARVVSGSYAPSPASSKPTQTITITRSGSQPSRQAPNKYFTGSVRIDPLFQAKDPSHTSGSYVTFEPGARSAWHTHPLGQTLIVTVGTGRVQRWGDPIEEIRPGDVVWIPPGQKHWHGASPTTAMTHIAIQGAVGGHNVNWMEKVSEEEYRKMDAKKSETLASVPTLEDIRMVAPALARYTQGVLLGDLWNRPGLSARDRSLITVSVLIARSQSTELPSHLNQALDNGVKASEISEVITISHSTPAGRMRCRRLRSQKMYFARVVSEPISFLRPRVRFFPLTRRPNHDARLLSNKMSARSLRESCSTPVTHCFMTCGCVRP